MRPLLLLAVLLASLQASPAGIDPGAVTAIQSLFDEWRYAEAETRARALLAEVEASHGGDSLAAAQALDLVVQALWHEAETHQATTRIINDGLEGEVDFGGTWHEVNWEEAQRLAERAVTIKQTRLGAEHAAIAESLDNFGSLLRSQGHYAEAKQQHERALAMRRSVLGPDHPDVARSLTSLAVVLRRSGDYNDAKRLYVQALEIRERTLGPEHPDVARSLVSLAVAAGDIGDFEEQQRFLERAMGVLRGRNQPALLAAVLRGLAGLLLHTGDFDGSSRAADEGLTLQQQVGPGHPRFVGLLIGAGSARAEIGDHARAQTFLERAVAVSGEIRGPADPVRAWALNNLGEVLSLAGDYEAAKQRIGQALAIYRRVYEPGHAQLETALCALADALYLGGDVATAKTYLGPSFRSYEEGAPTSNPSVLWCTLMYGNLLRDTGEAERARRLYEHLLGNMERDFGPHYPYIARLLRDMALLSLELGDETGALGAALRTEEIARDHLRLTSRGVSERNALLYAAQRVTGLDLALSIVSQTHDAASRRAVLDSVIRSRGIVLDEMAARRRTLGETPEVARLAQELASASQRIANLTVRGPGQSAPLHYRNLLDSTLEERERVERELARTSAAFQREEARSKVAWGDVTRVLPSGSALLAYVYYERLERPAKPSEAGGHPTVPKLVPSYAALVLRSGADAPDILPLGEAREIDSRVARWRREIAAGAAAAATSRERAYHEGGVSLRRAIWDPLAPHLGESTRLFVVPDGSLNLVNLAALPVGEAGYLVEKGPLIHYLSAERDLVPVGPLCQEAKRLLAIGGPSYDERSLFASLARRRHDEAESPPVPIAASGAFRGARSGCGGFQTLRFEALPASGLEVRDVVERWEAASGSPSSGVTQLTGPAASETAFKREAPGHAILHVATHGFFLGHCPSAVYTSRGIGKVVAEGAEEEPSPGQGENPLLLSGLALAGANQRWAASAEEDDGVLTAEEIAALDLSNVDWAVLSACDTGVGEIRAGEGVFGLRRAFQVAGARTLIMSLWPVEDESARQWMRALYEARLVSGLGTAEAVREASLTVLRKRRERGLSTHPFYWAGFVAAGDWR